MIYADDSCRANLSFRIDRLKIKMPNLKIRVFSFSIHLIRNENFLLPLIQSFKFLLGIMPGG